jgi:hypothetical protein
MAKESVFAIIDAYQRRRQEFKPLWNRNFLYFMLPGFALFGLAHPMVLDVEPLVLLGFGIFAVGMMRGIWIMRRYLRCPVCDRFQSPQKSYPHRVCLGCGAALSRGHEDS